MIDLPSPNVAARRPAQGADAVQLIVRWFWVGVPLAWGVSQSIIQSLALFW